MECDGHHRGNIYSGNGKVLEAEDYHLEDIEPTKLIQAVGYLRVGHPHGEVKQMIDKKNHNQKPCPDHSPAAECRPQVLFHRIFCRSCSVILQSKSHSKIDVNCKYTKHDKTECPHNRRQAVQLFTISVDPTDIN